MAFINTFLAILVKNNIIIFANKMNKFMYNAYIYIYILCIMHIFNINLRLLRWTLYNKRVICIIYYYYITQHVFIK